MNFALLKTPKSFLILSLITFIILASEARAETDSVFPYIPDIHESSIILNTNSGQLDKEKALYEIKENYFLIQSKLEQIKISKEVRKHFESAIEKAEEKYDEGEGDVSQSDITKLKLGLAGTLNDINDLAADIKIAKLTIGSILDIEFTPDSPLQDDTTTILDYTPPNDLKLFKKQGKFEIEKHMVKVSRSKKAFQLAKKNRKITRSLLVTELANYDFGIGSPDELFQALIIYTRVLRGYYQALFEFNKSVIKMDFIQSRNKT